MNWKRIVLAGLLLAGSGSAVAAPPKKKIAKEVPATAHQMEDGKKTFNSICAACHRPDGTGMVGMFPPVAKSDYLMADKKRSIAVVIQGLKGPVEVNGKKYNQVMPPLPQLTDEQVANVLSYVRNSFGNKGGAVTVDEVKEVRASTGSAAATR